MSSYWLNPLQSSMQAERVRLNIIKDLIQFDLLDVHLDERPAEISTRIFPAGKTVTMPTEIEQPREEIMR